MRRLVLAASGLMVLGMGAGVARAQPIQGLYIGAAGGANFLDTERTLTLRSASGASLAKPGQPANYKAGWAALGSIGYAFGNGFRVEVEGSGRSNDLSATAAGGSGRETKTGAMANVLFDMDIGSRYVFPYIGAGAGYQSVGYERGGLYRFNTSQNSFAYQAMLGASFPIPGVVGLSATAEYRYLTTNGHRRYAGTSGGAPISVQTADNNNHELLVGLRYAFNVPAPAAPAAAPVPVAAAPAPAPAPSRSYLVFFDWDKYDLNERARQIVAEAADASRHVADTRISVAGHADSSGTKQYNQELSRKRAAVVAGELVRLGVPAASITVTSFGDTRPLVATAPGTREPQNRRVEIVLK
jgi:outer membrane protein OmpA-like peptidoglycan-associated protein